MSARGKVGTVFAVLGVACVVAAFALFAYNVREATEADQAAQSVVTELIGMMETTNPGSEHKSYHETFTINGNKYIGFLTVPSLDLELPVMASFSYDHLHISPCRYSGSVLTNDLVICAHSYTRHFGLLHVLNPGDEVLFTDANKTTYRYKVADQEVLEPTMVEEMTAGEYPLTLFTCTYGGATRQTVRCERVETTSKSSKSK